jgi:protein-tyrosine phosphatase
MLVHCSAGCGRTGAFCTVDNVIDILKRQRLAVMNRANGSQPKGEKRNSVSRPGQSRDAEGDVNMEPSASPFGTSKDSSPFFGRDESRTNKGDHNATGNNGAEAAEIDSSWLDDDTVDLIASTVEDFRGQRLSMVQSLRQFVLCYETVIEWIWRFPQAQPAAGGGGRSRARSGSLNR